MEKAIAAKDNLAGREIGFWFMWRSMWVPLLKYRRKLDGFDHLPTLRCVGQAKILLSIVPAGLTSHCGGRGWAGACVGNSNRIAASGGTTGFGGSRFSECLRDWYCGEWYGSVVRDNLLMNNHP